MARGLRIGVMGGTFDPPHMGHLIVAEQAREALRLDTVLFIPAGIPVFKKEQKVTPAEDRLRMCEIACASNPAFQVSDVEIARGGDTYTVDTLEQLHEMHPDADFWTIVGSDAFALMGKWYRSDDIARLSHIAVLVRPGCDTEALQRTESLKRFDASFLHVTQVDISSTGVREKARCGETIRYLVPDGVREYIRGHGLYGESIVWGDGAFDASASNHAKCKAHGTTGKTTRA